MQLSSTSVLEIVNTYRALGNYPQAYQVVRDDLTAYYPNASNYGAGLHPISETRQ
jgi:hypothetical protein